MSKSKIVLFNISKSYQMKEILGEGAYGVVSSAIHKPSGVMVAIKKIEPFAKVLVCLRTIRELKLLKFFSNHENIIGLYDVQKPKDFDSFNEIYLVQEYMPMDLYKAIHTQHLLGQHIKFFVYQIMRGLKAIHSANVIHRDLKPSNILVNYNCEVKICDFGLSRIHAPDLSLSALLENHLTEYVATRWYRAPEIMLLLSMYSTSVDLWSVGCIMAELFIKTPLFPGKDYRNQIMLILQFLGTPQGSDFECIQLPRAKAYIGLLPRYDPVDIPDYINCHPHRLQRVGDVPVNSEGLDLMGQLLNFNPIYRPDALTSLTHEYLAQYHDPMDEPLSKVVLKSDAFDMQSKSNLSMAGLKRQLYEQIMSTYS